MSALIGNVLISYSEPSLLLDEECARTLVYLIRWCASITLAFLSLLFQSIHFYLPNSIEIRFKTPVGNLMRFPLVSDVIPSCYLRSTSLFLYYERKIFWNLSRKGLFNSAGNHSR